MMTDFDVASQEKEQKLWETSGSLDGFTVRAPVP